MNELGIGSLIVGKAERDAIHVAVVPLVAKTRLSPGDWVWLSKDFDLDGMQFAIECLGDEKAVGIVDPFLTDEVEPGQRFWCFLIPGTVTRIRHEWQHPAFTIRNPDKEHEDWLRGFARKWNFDYDEMILRACSTGEWRTIVAMGHDLHSFGELGPDGELFWEHLEAMTGQTFSQEHRDGICWSCSC